MIAVKCFYGMAFILFKNSNELKLNIGKGRIRVRMTKVLI